jgi:hypothetical protein
VAGIFPKTPVVAQNDITASVTVVSIERKKPFEKPLSKDFFSSVVVIRESYYSEIPNGPDCDRSVKILQISYDVSLGKIVMSKWAGTISSPLKICINLHLIKTYRSKNGGINDYVPYFALWIVSKGLLSFTSRLLNCCRRLFCCNNLARMHSRAVSGTNDQAIGFFYPNFIHV